MSIMSSYATSAGSAKRCPVSLKFARASLKLAHLLVCLTEVGPPGSPPRDSQRLRARGGELAARVSTGAPALGAVDGSDTPGGRRFHRKLGTGNKSGSALRSGRLFGEGPASPGQQALGTAGPAVRGRHGKAHQVRHARTSGQGPGQRHRCPQRRRDRPRRDAAARPVLFFRRRHLGGQPGWHQPPGPHPRAHHVRAHNRVGG